MKNIFKSAGRFFSARVPQIVEAIKPSVTVESKVNGFVVSLSQKDGPTIFFEGEEGKQDKPASETKYFEVVVKPTGENPDYPEGPQFITRFTVGTQPCSSGFTGSTAYVPAGSKFTKFEVIEEYNDGKLKPGFMGYLLPAHHSVMLQAHYKTPEGNIGKMGLGAGWKRKSEIDRPEWQAKARMARHIHYC